MPFRARNSLYLRISATNVIPLYLYLDDRHIEWMTDRTLQFVISDLRPLLMPKLKAEANAQLGFGGPANAKRAEWLKQHNFEFIYSDHYQFAYFLRKVEPHSVVVKTRNYVMRPLKPKQESPPPVSVSPTKQAGGARKRKGTSGSSTRENTKRPRQSKAMKKGKSADFTGDGDEDEPNEITSGSEGDDAARTTSNLRRSIRTKRAQAAGAYLVDSADEGDDGSYEDNSPSIEQHPIHPEVKIEESEPPISSANDGHTNPPTGPAMDLDIDEEEEKVKPILQLQYQGFSIHSRCLCVVVEPWPPVRGSTRALSTAPQMPPPRISSIAPPDFEAATFARDTRASVPPLFLPDFDRERSVTPAIGALAGDSQRMTSPLLTFDDAAQDAEDEENFGMMAFSQVLNSVSGEATGGVGEDDEIDGSVFFGDADEVRDIS